MLFTMTNLHFYTKLPVNMFGKMLRRIYTAMLTACTSETEHQRGETTLHVAVYMMVGKCIDMIQELQYLTIILQESDNRLIQTRQLLIRLVSARVMGTSAVEDITSTIARRILWNALTERKTIHSYHQRSLTIIFRIGGRSVLRMRTIDIVVGSLIAVCTTQRHTLYHLELWQFGQSSQHIHHIRIREYLVTHLQKIAQILDSWRNTVDEMLLAFEIAAESVGAQNL